MATQTVLGLVLKLIQLNAWLGRLNGPLERFIEAEQPDIICLQEAYLPNPQGVKVLADQFNFLDRVRSVSGLTYEFFAKNWSLPIAGTYYEEGNVLLSRFPISNEQQTHIHGKYHVRNSEADSIPNTRVWQAATLTLPDGRGLSVSTYHGYLGGAHDGMGDDTTIETMRTVSGHLAALPRPLIFTGDLNFWPVSPALKELENLNMRNLSVDYSVPTTLSEAHRAEDPNRSGATCDYIFVSPGINVLKFSVSEQIVSDHKALILEFEP